MWKAGIHAPSASWTYIFQITLMLNSLHQFLDSFWTWSLINCSCCIWSWEEFLLFSYCSEFQAYWLFWRLFWGVCMVPGSIYCAIFIEQLDPQNLLVVSPTSHCSPIWGASSPLCGGEVNLMQNLPIILCWWLLFPLLTFHIIPNGKSEPLLVCIFFIPTKDKTLES